ncbi:MAG: helix-turn-helix transcriptional regulator, partial [Alphaproteobacteria bacterium]|nr:helix-turn-helix transcriptional regulator [Alphaproteobacteria bacterium]
MSNLDQTRVASRSTETTRAALIKAATSVFAEYGYDGGSVRLITQRAMANQAAVNYHFGGKDGLYREVLK